MRAGPHAGTRPLAHGPRPTRGGAAPPATRLRSLTGRRLPRRSALWTMAHRPPGERRPTRGRAQTGAGGYTGRTGAATRLCRSTGHPSCSWGQCGWPRTCVMVQAAGTPRVEHDTPSESHALMRQAPEPRERWPRWAAASQLTPAAPDLTPRFTCAGATDTVPSHRPPLPGVRCKRWLGLARARGPDSSPAHPVA